ncbi:ATP-binding protein [Tamlana sp. 2201CG12-4]|uniref:ATP-binding protein n=1 Tax=Tamlana sp. 2201CG12-4 TaxID=3112582 RepID=UPI002DBA7662|nr:ATP-binding protein [Tamlana sp. 2201CG12-4]MEC3905544.1 ATP-binding protein [Tamlana sp. 2201CG12-4]
MKELNLLSLVQSSESIPEPVLTRYYDYFKISPKKDELADLSSFNKMLQTKTQEINSFDKFFFGYTIPQIGKEFDLLRFGDNYVVNIELKRTSTSEKIKKQLKRNKYYLSFLNVNILSFTFIASDKKLFKLDNNEDLIEESFDELARILQNQEVKQITNVDTLFNPSNYLVSPFNSTDKFIDGKYFLTQQQEEIKNECLEKINNNEVSFVSISGRAGTGKTLLTYDIVKECISKNLNVLVVHCGLLNEGHYKLRDEYKWDIIAIKELHNKNIANYSLVVLDETQRIYTRQLDHIIKEIKNHKKNCLFSYDQLQCLRKKEISNNIEEYIKNKTQAEKYNLTKKIRTNKEIASFIRCLLDRNKNIDGLNKSNIELNYFKSYSEAKAYIKYLKEYEWKVINYTPSRGQSLPYDNFKIIEENENAHSVIGQEFDKVVAIVDKHFYYNEENKLSTKNYKNSPYYHPTKMLLQIMTRTRIKLSFIVIDNDEILERCLNILNPVQ